MLRWSAIEMANLLRRLDTCRRERASAPRSLARRLALQALYQLQINPRPWQDVHQQFAADPEAERVDRDYFRELIEASRRTARRWTCALRASSEIAPAELDPIEHAVLWLGLYELQSRPELPYRVAHRRSGAAGQAIRRDRWPQVRQCGAGSRRQGTAPARYGRP